MPEPMADPARAAAVIARLVAWNEQVQARDPGSFTDDEVAALRRACMKLQRALDLSADVDNTRGSGGTPE